METFPLRVPSTECYYTCAQSSSPPRKATPTSTTTTTFEIQISVKFKEIITTSNDDDERRFVFVFICFLFEAITLLIKQEPELDSMQETGYKSLSMRNQSSTVVLDLTEFTGSQGKSKRLTKDGFGFQDRIIKSAPPNAESFFGISSSATKRLLNKLYFLIK